MGMALDWGELASLLQAMTDKQVHMSQSGNWWIQQVQGSHQGSKQEPKVLSFNFVKAQVSPGDSLANPITRNLKPTLSPPQAYLETMLNLPSNDPKPAVQQPQACLLRTLNLSDSIDARWTIF